MLGFNGANLAWQNAPVGGVRVVDSLDRLVGPFEFGTALREIGGAVFRIGVNQNGFSGPGSVQFSHTSLDCSGPRYTQQAVGALIRNSDTVGRKLFYAAEPLQLLTINSYEDLDLRVQDVNQPGFCIRFPNHDTFTYGLTTTFDLSTLGLVPPFHLEF